MLTASEFREFFEDISSEELSIRVATLKVFRDDPSSDERVLPYLEHLLHDKTPCVLAIPYIFGEVRWLAAHTLAAEREALGIMKPVHLPNVLKPIDTTEYGKARNTANIRGRGGVEGVLENIAFLRDMGYLPLYNLKLSYWIEEPHEIVAMRPMRPLIPAAVAAMA